MEYRWCPGFASLILAPYFKLSHIWLKTIVWKLVRRPCVLVLRTYKISSRLVDSIAKVDWISLWCCLLQKPLNKGIRKVKLSNSYFQKNILGSSGGLALFLFSPGTFKFTYDHAEKQCIVQCYEPLLEEEGGTIAIHDWIQALQDFCSFLHALLDVCSWYHDRKGDR